MIVSFAKPYCRWGEILPSIAVGYAIGSPRGELVAALLMPEDALAKCPKVTLQTVTDVRAIQSLEADYARLCRVTGNRLPFSLHAWHLTWCRHFLNCDPRIEEEPLFYILRDAQNDCVAILPFIVSRRRFGPLKVVSVASLGADPAITEIRVPLIQEGYGHLTARAVRDALEHVADWDWIHWCGLDGEFAETLSAAKNVYRQPPLSDFVLDLPPSWEEFRSGLKHNIRESLRHGYNSLARQGHSFELEVIDSPRDLEPALSRFLRLHRMRASFAYGAAHADRFASPVSEKFLYAVCERLAERGTLKLFALKIGAEVAAMRIGFEVGDALYLYYSGFDPKWWKFGVMTTTMAEAIKYAIGRGLRIVNLSPVRDLAKTRWGPRQVDYGSAYETRDRLRSRLANSAYLRIKSNDASKLLQRFIASRSWN
jgi:CelD/BcsL family acetyltransferase involved in cellulose biosynthesis